MKILLVEDDSAICLLIEQSLSAHHTVEIAKEGRSALALTEQFEYDLLLLDIDLPEIDGISVCKQLRTRGCQVPILLLTAKDRVSDRVMGLDAGADDYMVKPFHLPELLARIRALQRRGRTIAAPVVTWEKLQLNGLTHEICYDEQLLHLTPKEYGILELLLLHPQQIFRRSAIIDRLWEMEETPTESAISSHIKAIRQKLKAAGATHDFIETIYGFGYRLRSTSPSQPDAIKTKPSASPSQLSPETQTGKASQEAVDAALIELWERFKDSFNDHLDVLVQTVSALKAGTLTTDLQQKAKQSVHKLVGSLGVYGFSQGSILARQIEGFLQPGLVLDRNELQQLAQWVASLQQEISQPPKLATTAITPQPRLPRVLVVDGDLALTERLRVEATARSLQLIVAPNTAAAHPIVAREQLDVILLDLTTVESHKEGLIWLERLQQQYAQIPVVIFAGQDSLSDRVAAVRLGVRALLQKPIAMEQIFQTIQTLLDAQSSSTGKVMVVDDDPIILHQVSVVLSPWGLQVTTLQEPERFWDVLTGTAPDLLLLDIEMPEFNGIELCEVVRHDSKWGNLPILFLTAHQEVDMLVQAFAAGGDDYIRKPILEPELLARVLNRLEGRKGLGCRV
ncbi:MAG: response regulator [Leptolyngbya sp. BL-A-14]